VQLFRVEREPKGPARAKQMSPPHDIVERFGSKLLGKRRARIALSRLWPRLFIEVRQPVRRYEAAVPLLYRLWKVDVGAKVEF
jgi:hypothetical protein